MKSALIFGLAASCNLAQGSSTSGHPIEKVIKMLEGLAEKAEEEGKTEAVSFDKFMHWCATSTKTLDSAIADEKDTIETLTDQIAGEEKMVAKLEKQIATLEEQIKEMDQAAEDAKALRKEGADLYAKTESDFKGTIKAIADAIKGLKESDGTFLAQKVATPQLRRVLALAELKGVKEEQRSALAFLLQKPEQLAEGDRAKHVKAYNFKSGNIIELLKELQRKFEDDLLASTKAETNALNAYDLEKQARDAANAAAEKSKKEKTATLGEVEADLAQHKSDLADTENELATDSETLAETKKSCATKTQEWEERSAVRTNEIAAMGKAIEILAKTTGVRTEAPGNPVPPPAPAFLQVSLQVEDPKQKALNLLRSKARETKSRALAKMAQQLAAHLGDPFKDINNMIEKMIFHLQAEQTDEDKHKAWCDQEISKTETSQKNKKEKIEELTTKIDAAQATVTELTEDIAAATEMLAKIAEFVEESTEIREIGKKENAKAVADAEAAQNAVANAIAVLTDFYKESGNIEKEEWEFVQRGVDLPKNPDTWGSSYTGVSDSKGGILTILEEVAAKFAAMEADTKAQEAQDQSEYAKQMSESDIEKAGRTKEAEMKEQEKKRLVDKLEALKKTRKHVSGELEAVDQYFEDLKPACMDGDSSYEDRKAARDKEIEALRQAEDILAKAFEDKASLVAISRV